MKQISMKTSIELFNYSLPIIFVNLGTYNNGVFGLRKAYYVHLYKHLMHLIDQIYKQPYQIQARFNHFMTKHLSTCNPTTFHFKFFFLSFVNRPNLSVTLALLQLRY